MITLALSLVLALVASWFILTPIIEGVNIAEVNNSHNLEIEKERLFSKLEELEQEKVLSRISEENYKISKQEIFNKIVECTEQLKKE